MKRLMIVLTVFLFITLVACPSFAQRGGWGGSGGWGGEGGGRNRGGPPGEQSRSMPGGRQSAEPTAVPDFQIIDLNLNADQISRINVLREAFLREVKPLQDEMRSKRGDVKRLRLEQNQDEEKIAAIHKELNSLKDQMRDKTAGYVLEVRKILTPYQDSLLRSCWPGLDGSKEREMGSNRGDGPGDGPGGVDAGRGPRGSW